jgi:hypothetical protein
MITRRFDLNVSKDDLASAYKWWRSLSINQQKGFESKHQPNAPKPLGERWVHQIWEEEGKPAEQQPIPIPPEFLS